MALPGDFEIVTCFLSLTASLSVRRLSLRPLPSVGEGSSAVQHNGLGEGKAATPHPTEFVETKVMPSPAGGEGAITAGALHGTAQSLLALLTQ